MAGYWQSFFCVCLWTETKSMSVKTGTKKEKEQYLAILVEQAWSIKDLLQGKKANILAGHSG